MIVNLELEKPDLTFTNEIVTTHAFDADFNSYEHKVHDDAEIGIQG